MSIIDQWHKLGRVTVKPWTCAECSSSIPRFDPKIEIYRCPRCGASHFNGELMGPSTTGMSDACEYVSGWRPHTTRPAFAGAYDCRFRSTEPAVLRLDWDGTDWRHLGLIVDPVDFLAWRGQWA